MPGDRKSLCGGRMKPIALRFKEDGEIMVVHKCLSCGKISSNRIAGDDFADAILGLILQEPNGDLLTIKDSDQIHAALFGKK